LQVISFVNYIPLHRFKF
jgi:hypothetical protein